MVTAIAMVLVACESAETRTCRQSGKTEFCLVESGEAYNAEGHGFAPGSEVTMTVDDGRDPAAGQPSSRADADGNVPAQGARAGVLPGPSPQRVTVAGTARTGEPVSFEFVVPTSGS